MVRLGLSLLVVLSLLIAGLPAPTSVTASPSRQVEMITVEMVDLAFEPADLTVTPGTRITVFNLGQLPHNWALEGTDLRTDTAEGGDATPQTITIPRDLAPGTYEILCEVPGHSQAGMVGTLTVVARETGSGDDETRGDESERDTPLDAPEIDLDMGDGWEIVEEDSLDLGTGENETPSTVISLHGPESSTARVIVGTVDVANGRPTFDEWATFITTVGAGFYPTDADIPDSNACLIANSVQGIEPLTSARIGSTVCLTNNQFVWTSVSGQWSPDGDPLLFSEASVALVELVLDQNS